MRHNTALPARTGIDRPAKASRMFACGMLSIDKFFLRIGIYLATDCEVGATFARTGEG
jgi:hypothetical protein